MPVNINCDDPVVKHLEYIHLNDSLEHPLNSLKTLQKILGVKFKAPPLLQKALIHSSYVNEKPNLILSSNERLEFLGDAVLGVVMATLLFNNFPYLDEGQMTKYRSVLVNRDTLSSVAKRNHLGDYLLLGKGEELSNGRGKPANLARTLEAILGSIYLDQGFASAYQVIKRLFNEELQQLSTRGIKTDYKSQLQEVIQGREKKIPIYHLIEASGPGHERRFTVEVKVDDITLGQGIGKNKKAAEMEAAKEALKTLNSTFTPKNLSVKLSNE